MKKLITLMLLTLILSLCGCAGYREINRGYLVTAIGFSSTADNTTIFIEALSSSDVIPDKSERVVFWSNGKDADKAYKNLKNSLVKPLYFEQMGTAVFEGEIEENLVFLRKNLNINYDIYLVNTSNMKALFENDSPNGVLGYDVITLIKTQSKEKATNQLYKVQTGKEMLPIVDFKDGKLMLKQVTEQ